MNEDPLIQNSFKGAKPSFKVTKYLEKLIENVEGIRRQFVPSIEEKEENEEGLVDPLSEEEYLVYPKCVHKYQDRVLIWANNVCFANCRFCTRRRMIKKRESIISDAEVDKIAGYLEEHREVRDVIISGGDPLMLTNSKLKYILSKIRKVESVQIIRIGTRAPIVQPKRVTSKLVNMLKRFSPLYVNVHVNHFAELTEEVKRATDLMVDNGLVLGSQTVLLKGVNDSKETMVELMKRLLQFRIRPYYLYSCDKVLGTRHFWTNPQVGIDIVKYLQKVTSGLAVPRFVIDTSDRKVTLA
jgi:lysine 2,3-aminomutase